MGRIVPGVQLPPPTQGGGSFGIPGFATAG
jgi:hypothetical protein